MERGARYGASAELVGVTANRPWATRLSKRDHARWNESPAAAQRVARGTSFAESGDRFDAARRSAAIWRASRRVSVPPRGAWRRASLAGPAVAARAREIVMFPTDTRRRRHRHQWSGRRWILLQSPTDRADENILPAPASLFCQLSGWAATSASHARRISRRWRGHPLPAGRRGTLETVRSVAALVSASALALRGGSRRRMLPTTSYVATSHPRAFADARCARESTNVDGTLGGNARGIVLRKFVSGSSAENGTPATPDAPAALEAARRGRCSFPSRALTASGRRDFTKMLRRATR